MKRSSTQEVTYIACCGMLVVFEYPNILSPEFVKSNPVSLSSDAYSPFDKSDPQAEENRRAVLEVYCSTFICF